MLNLTKKQLFSQLNVLENSLSYAFKNQEIHEESTYRIIDLI
jgi:hypothetical protein